MEITEEQLRDLTRKVASSVAESSFRDGFRSAAIGIRQIAAEKPDSRELLLAIADSIEATSNTDAPEEELRVVQ